MKINNQAKFNLLQQKVIFFVLFATIIGMVAWLSHAYNYSVDLTADKRHSLSGGSIDLLKKLKKPITLHAYTNGTVNKQAIKEIISRYQKYKSNFKLNIYNPDVDISQAQQDGIVMKNQFAFVIFHNNKSEAIYTLSESAISNALLRLSRNNSTIVFLKGHGERKLNATNNTGFSYLKTQLNLKGFNLQAINLLTNKLPKATKVLVIASPTDNYFAGELTKIQQYLAQGGNILMLADPGNNTNSATLLNSLSLTLQAGIIVDNDEQLRETLNIKSPATLAVTQYYPHQITNSIPYNTVFFLARGISPLTTQSKVAGLSKAWVAEALFSSSKKSWSDADAFNENKILSKSIVYNANRGDKVGPITFAVALHRESPSASNTKTQRAVIIGDSDFLTNKYIGMGANQRLGINILNWLAKDDAVLSIETKNQIGKKLILTNREISIIGFGFFLIIPLFLLAIGFYINYKRQKNNHV